MDNPNIDSAGVDAGAKILVGLMKTVFPSLGSLPQKRLEASVLLGLPVVAIVENISPNKGHPRVLLIGEDCDQPS
jgi:hypothetical protein